MNPLKLLTLPQYLFRPRQVFVRLQRAISRPPPEFARVELPWGDSITVRPREIIGAVIWYYGVFDLIVTEAICRLLDPSELALDIGANNGQMSSLMRRCAGPRGKVIAIEPHPELFAELQQTVREPQHPASLAPVELHQVALSDREGEAVLDVGPSWHENRGLSKIVSDSTSFATAAVQASPGRALRVRTTTLDLLLDAAREASSTGAQSSSAARVGVCKIDVEGHELQVFRGAARLLDQQRMRDVIFEDFGEFPSPVHRMFLERGFTLFSLHSSLLRPILSPVLQERPRFSQNDGENYLATLDPQRAIERFAPGGWRVLRKPAPRPRA